MLLLSFGLMCWCLIFRCVNVALFTWIKRFTVSGFLPGGGWNSHLLVGGKDLPWAWICINTTTLESSSSEHLVVYRFRILPRTKLFSCFPPFCILIDLYNSVAHFNIVVLTFSKLWITNWIISMPNSRDLWKIASVLVLITECLLM